MTKDIELLLELKKLKSSLLKDIVRIDNSISKLITSDPVTLDKMTNDETLGIYDYQLCETHRDKILFGLDRLGAANIDDLGRYLGILGEDLSKIQMKKWLRNTISMLVSANVVQEVEINGIVLFTINRNHDT